MYRSNRSDACFWRYTRKIYSPSLQLWRSQIRLQAYFLLSGEAEFSELGADHDFKQFYDTRVEILEKTARKKKTAHLHRELHNYFNENLFTRDDMVEKNAIDPEEAQLLKAIDDSDEDDEEQENGNLNNGSSGSEIGQEQRESFAGESSMGQE